MTKSVCRRALAIATLIVYSVSTIAQTVPSKAFIPSAETGEKVGVRDGCDVISMPVYDMTGYWYQAHVQTCPGVQRDFTTGANAPKPKDQLIMSTGRLVIMEKGYSDAPPGFLFRGAPNTPYSLAKDDKFALTSYSVDFPKASYSWNSLEHVFPFVPTKFYDLGVVAGAYRMIAYGGLKILPSKAAQAYPLDRNSVIVMMHGVSFRREIDILALHQSNESWPPGVESRLIDIVYFQLNENPRTLRRAFIPQFHRDTVAKEWAEATSDPGAQFLASGKTDTKDKFGHYAALAGTFLAIGALLYGISAVSTESGSSITWQSGSDNDIGRNKQDNAKSPESTQRSRKSNAISPFYDEPGWGTAMPADAK
jgi:hypothetical protein